MLPEITAYGADGSFYMDAAGTVIGSRLATEPSVPRNLAAGLNH